MFIVAKTSRLAGTPNWSPEWGMVASRPDISPPAALYVARLSNSNRVISSPNILATFPRLISSMKIAYR